MNTWQHGNKTCPHCEKFHSQDDLGPEILSELPPHFDEYSQAVLIYPAYRIIAYHTLQTIRYKLANFLELQLFERDLAPYFADRKSHARGPVPDVPPAIVERVRQGDQLALRVMNGQTPAYNKWELDKYCAKAGITVPFSAPSSTAPPPVTGGHYPALPKSSSTSAPYRSLSTGSLTVHVSTSGKPTNQATSMTAQRPPPPPAPASAALPADTVMEPAPEAAPDVHMTEVDNTDMSFIDMLACNEAAHAPSEDPVDISLDTPIRSSSSTHLRPTIHPPTRPDPDVPMTPAAPQQPFL